MPKLRQNLTGSIDKHEPKVDPVLSPKEQKRELPNMEINLGEMVVTLNDRKIDFRKSSLAWRFLVLLGRKPNEDLPSSVVTKMAIETGATGDKYGHLANCMSILRNKIEKDPHDPRILITTRHIDPRRYTYRLCADVVFIGNEEVKEPTETFVFPDRLTISGLTKLEIKVAKNIPFYPEEGIPRSKLAMIAHRDINLTTAKQRLSQDISSLRRKVSPESGWNIVNVIPLSARRKGTEAVYCWKKGDKKRSPNKLGKALQAPLDLQSAQQVDNNPKESKKQSLFTKKEIFVLANVLNDGNPEVFKKHGFPIDEDRKDIILETIRSLGQKGIRTVDPWLVETKILPSLVDKLRSLSPDNIESVFGTYPILGLLVNITCDKEQLASFVKAFEHVAHTLIKKHSSKR